jgi:Tat protein translocase TatB subunit
MFGIGMPELLVIAVVALLVVGPKKLPDIAKALGKGLSEFRRATDSATETIKETLKTDELKKDVDGFKDSLLRGTVEEKGAPVPPVAPAGGGHDAASYPPDVPKTADIKPQP